MPPVSISEEIQISCYLKGCNSIYFQVETEYALVLGIYLAVDSDDRPKISKAAQDGSLGGSPLTDFVHKNYVLFLCCLGKTVALTANLKQTNSLPGDIQGQAGCGSGHPGLVVDHPVHGTGVETR